MRKRALMEHFGSLDELGRASVEEIMAVRNMNRDVAERIHSHFRARKP